MKIGIISDTHDRLSMIDAAVQRLNLEEVDIVLHAGDYIAPFVVPRFRLLKAKMIGVLGNNDGEKNLLKKKFEEIGVQIQGKFAEVEIDGLKIALLHGHQENLLSSLVGTHHYDVVAHGHTHQVEIHREVGTLVINPGEICGYLNGNPSFAILHTKPVQVEIVSIGEQEARIS